MRAANESPTSIAPHMIPPGKPEARSKGETGSPLRRASGSPHCNPVDTLMATIAEALSLAHHHQPADEFAQAEQLYTQVLQFDGRNADAWFNLGRLYQDSGKAAAALDCWQHAVALKPDFAEARSRLGMALADQGRLDQAVVHYQQALRLQPNDIDSHYNLGNALAALDRLDQAVLCMNQVLRLRPGHVEAITNLGIFLARKGKVAEAVPLLPQAIQLKPDNAKAHNNLGVALADLGRRDEALASWREALRLKPDYAEAHFNLAVALADLGRREEAVASYESALKNKPDYPAALSNLGLLLTEMGRLAEAVAALRQAVRLKPEYAEAHNNLGLALVERGQFDEALAAYHEALRLRPSYIEAHNNLGSLYGATGRPQDALAAYRQALWLQPDYAEVRWNRALVFLQTGDFAQGWPEYEWRWKRRRPAGERPFAQPLWDGSLFPGRTILLYAEQGLGDALQFIRYAALVKERGGEVVVESPPELLHLLATCPGVDRVVAEGSPLPDFAIRAPLMGLPNIFRTTLDTIPATVPYLSPDPERLARWEKELAGSRSFKVGIAWQGNPRHRWDRHRSFPLQALEPLAAVKGVQLYSLQKGPGVEQLAALGNRIAVTDFGNRLDAAVPFADTAAIVRQLDLVVTCDSVLAHLAGALAVPVWVALPTISDWRWLLDREDSPWYPTLRLFRQRAFGRWDEVFERMATALRQSLVGNGDVPLTVPVSPGELLDWPLVVEIHIKKTADVDKLRRLRFEAAQLKKTRDHVLPKTQALTALTTKLKALTAALWDLKDALRACESREDFGPKFIEVVRSISQTNDERAEMKKQIDELLGHDSSPKN